MLNAFKCNFSALLTNLQQFRIDYCNSVLYGLLQPPSNPLLLLHCAGKLIKNSAPPNHVTSLFVSHTGFLYNNTSPNNFQDLPLNAVQKNLSPSYVS